MDKINTDMFPRSIVQNNRKCGMCFQCYYLGGLEESATGILGELSKPLSWSMPADKICEKLKKRDAQICDLRFGMYNVRALLLRIQGQLCSDIVTLLFLFQRNKSILTR